MSTLEDKKLQKREDEPDTFFQYFCNPSRGTIFGRSAFDCFRLTVFYIILYIVLAAFWLLMLLIFYQTLDERVPTYTLDQSRIGSNPGLGFRPRPRTKNVDSTLIWFKNGANEASWKYWANSLNEFLEPYQKATDQTGAHIQQCTGPQGWPSAGKFCYFDIKSIDNNCTRQNDFGYRRGDPCVLLKLNRIFNWRPEPFTSQDLATNIELPDSVRLGYANRSEASQLIYVTCEGENAADKEAIGPLDYYPAQGIEYRYFPYSNQPGYLSPFVMVHFAKPSPGVLINVECKAWAKNIKLDRYERKGSVHFELLMDGF